MPACLPACLFVCLSVCRCWCVCVLLCVCGSHDAHFFPPFQFDFRLSARNVEYGFSISVFQWNWICLQLFLMVIVVSAVCCRPNHLVSKKNANRSISIHFINIVKCRKFTNCIKCTPALNSVVDVLARVYVFAVVSFILCHLFCFHFLEIVAFLHSFPIK